MLSAAVALAVGTLGVGAGAAAPSKGRISQLPGPSGCLTSDAPPTCARVNGIDASSRVALSPDGRTVYVAGLASLAVLARDRGTGALTQAPGGAGCVQDPAPTWHKKRNCASSAGLWPSDVAVSPDGKNVYVTSAVDDRAHGGPFSSFVAVFRRDAKAGTLSERAQECIGVSDARRCSPARSLTSPGSIVVSPDGRNVYVGSQGGITVLRRSADGSLLQLAGPAGCVLAASVSSCTRRPPHTGGTDTLGISADGATVYAVVGTSAGSDANLLLVFKRDRTSGALAPLPGASGCLAAATRKGCGSAVGLSGVGWEFALAVSHDGKNLYVSSGDGVASFSRSATNGGLTQAAGTAGCLGSADWKSPCRNRDDVQPITGIVVSHDGAEAYVALQAVGHAAAPSIATFTRDPATGSLAFAGCEAQSGNRCPHGRGIGDMAGVALSPDDRNLYAVGSHGSYPAAARILAFARR